MVDRKSFLSWIVQQMRSCNLAQSAFVVRLADEYLDGMTENRALVQPFVEACLAKLTEVSLINICFLSIYLEPLATDYTCTRLAARHACSDCEPDSSEIRMIS